MATTAVHSIAEHDNVSPLGTLGPSRSVLHDEVELRRVLVAEFLASATGARDAGANVDSEPRSAVHDYRKALRRARAVLALVADSLPKSERRAIRRALQQARRSLGHARDHAVAPATLDQLALREVERATANAIVRNAAAALPLAAEVKQLLAEGAARALAQVEALEAALPPAVQWTSVVKGLRSTYRAARRARRGGKRTAANFHSWRRRSKELTYQLELLARFAGPDAAEAHHVFETATDAQGPAVDLIMVRDFVRTHAQGVAPDALEALLQAVDVQLDDLMRDARALGKDAFQRKPRKFARRLEKAIRKEAAAEPEASAS